MPAHVRAEPRQENGHICGKAAAADINVVTHFVNQNQNSETDAELPAPHGPIQREESAEAKEKFKFEKCEKPFCFRKKNGDRRERAKFFRPVIFWRRRGRLEREFEFADVIADPTGLSGLMRKHVE
ncbi:MAG: hypothetical protein DMG34_21785 [Acidobacteria bacterium]|nr:MAG: hypothetical protein DMG34_21785 [Acidobacteriota bacterium]